MYIILSSIAYKNEANSKLNMQNTLSQKMQVQLTTYFATKS